MQFLSHYSEDDIEIFISLIVEPFKCYKGNLRWLFFNNSIVFFCFVLFFLQLALLDSSRHCADSAIKLFTMFPKNYTSFIVIPFHLKLFSVDYQRNITNKFIIHIFLSAIWLPTTNFGSLSIYLFLPVQGIQVCKVIWIFVPGAFIRKKISVESRNVS